MEQGAAAETGDKVGAAAAAETETGVGGEVGAAAEIETGVGGEVGAAAEAKPEVEVGAVEAEPGMASADLRLLRTRI